MKLLAFDTSTEYLSLALWHDGEVTLREQVAGQKHSELLLPVLGELLAEAQWTLADMDGIVFGEGPGSFTGLRIACGVAQGLAFGAGLPVLGVCTLEALAQQAGAERVIACLDARMGEIYHAAYCRGDDGWQPVMQPGLYPPQQVPVVDGTGWCAIGSGWDSYGSILDGMHAGKLERKIAQAFPLAKDMAELAAPRLVRGAGKPPHEAAPLYIRNKVALTIREREAGK
jgi:tRNA threonylcarbamoyladenosine biosynthesis protein TsaB